MVVSFERLLFCTVGRRYQISNRFLETAKKKTVTGTGEDI